MTTLAVYIVSGSAVHTGLIHEKPTGFQLVVDALGEPLGLPFENHQISHVVLQRDVDAVRWLIPAAKFVCEVAQGQVLSLKVLPSALDPNNGTSVPKRLQARLPTLPEAVAASTGLVL